MRTDKRAQTWTGPFIFMLLGLLLAFAPLVRGDHTNIAGTDAKICFTGYTIAASGTATSTSFVGLSKSNFQSIQLRGVGTSPNFKCEIVATCDSANYVKPETGGDIGTFTDSNYHIISVGIPLCSGLRLKFTELGGVNPVDVDAILISQ